MELQTPGAMGVTWITDPALLLPGEDPTSTVIRDAVHWCQVYRELIEMTGALLERSDSAINRMKDGAALEARRTQSVLRAQRDQYSARYEFWRDRVGSLQAKVA
jgi:hypothetical protein